MGKNYPLRTCVGCRKKMVKSSMIRFVCTAGSVQVDKKQHLEGRGVYLCRDKSCVEKGLKPKIFLHALRISASRQKTVEQETLACLKKEVEKLIGEEIGEAPKRRGINEQT
jgi:predicted RNA-binding protein YlxR (DUF448 family)